MTAADWLALPLAALPPCRVRWVPGSGVVLVPVMPSLGGRRVAVMHGARVVDVGAFEALLAEGAQP